MALAGILMLAVPALAQDDAENKFAANVPDGGSVAPQATGGPDAFGYIWMDQSTGSCDYQFIDISGSGALLVSGDDDSSGPISLGGNDFSFYGTTYTDLVMLSNGNLSTDLTDGGGDVSNDCPLPATPSTNGGARIYAVHDDLVTNTGYYEWMDPCPRPADNWDHSDGNSPGCHVFMYDDAKHFASVDTFDLEVILYGITNEIVVMVPDGIDENGAGSTTGIQNESATDGLTYACNDGSTFPTGQDTAVCFFEEPSAPTDVSLSGFVGGSTGLPLWTAVAIALLTVAALGIFVTLRSRQEA